jgi:hypothetical protein
VITPQIITEIAEDFRLNVEVRSPVEQMVQGSDHAMEVQQAAKTLLDLYAYLRTAPESRSNLRVVVGTGARKNEPYI